MDIPTDIMMGSDMDQLSGETRKIYNQSGYNTIELENNTNVYNHVEIAIQILKNETTCDIVTTDYLLIF